MPDVLYTLEETIARLAAQQGVRWPNPWWPTGNASYDDCAAAMSWALFDLRPSGWPWETYVSGVIERSGLEKRTDVWGIRRGDVLGFLWPGSGQNYDHTEMALGSPNDRGQVLTIGTNAGPGDNMAVRVRSISNVVAYARPGYVSTAGGGGTPIEEEFGFMGNAEQYDYLLNSVRRGPALGRLAHDGGHDGSLPFDSPQVTRAVNINVAEGSLWWLSADHETRVGELRGEQNGNDGLFTATAERSDGMPTTAFNKLLDFLGESSLAHFNGVRAILDAAGVTYTITPRRPWEIVRPVG